MKKNITLVVIPALIAFMVISLSSCSKYKGFKEDDSGFYYKFYVKNDTSAQPQLGDVVEMIYTLRTKDSTLIATRPLQDRIIDALYKGDIYDALRTMHVGDSATFILDGDTFFHYYMNEAFNFPEKELYFDIKLTNIIPNSEVEEIIKENKRRQQIYADSLRLMEDSLISDYLKKQKITSKPTADGLYISTIKKGKGKPVTEKSSVSTHYSTYLLDGTLLDSSEGKEPFMLMMSNANVIPGFTATLLTMKEGDKVKVLIPSKMAYGPNGYQYVIPPYTPLVFDIEVLTVE